jgi:hypothetical protein
MRFISLLPRPHQAHRHRHLGSLIGIVIIHNMSQQVRLETTMGDIIVELYGSHAPRTCHNFYTLAEYVLLHDHPSSCTASHGMSQLF